MKVKTIKEGNVIVPKNFDDLTVVEFLFLCNYFNRAIIPTKLYKPKTKRK